MRLVEWCSFMFVIVCVWRTLQEGRENSLSIVFSMEGSPDPWLSHELPDSVLISELDRVEGLWNRQRIAQRSWRLLRQRHLAQSVVQYWSKRTGLIPWDSPWGSESSADACHSVVSHAVSNAVVADYQRRSYEYCQRLLAMSASRSYDVGKDGAPNWPSPP